MTRTAYVFKKSVPAATLTQNDDYSVTFSYLSTYSGPPVSHTLPLGQPPVTTPNLSLPAFFTGLLPEGFRLTQLERRLKHVSPSDELSLLLAIGDDVVGDIQISTSTRSPQAVRAPVTLDDSDLDFRRALALPETVHTAGVQEKVSAQMISFPATSTNNVHSKHLIIKLSPTHYPQLVENEAAHLSAAHHLKLPVAQHQFLIDTRHEKALAVSRFDRTGLPSQPIRYAVEDALQLLGKPPAAKYSTEAHDLIAHVSQFCQAPGVAARNLYLQFLFAWLTGNGDLHEKNISILESPAHGWEVSPIYDTVCTLVYGDDEMALPVNGKKKNLKHEDWVALAQQIGLPERALPRLYEIALSAAKKVQWETIDLHGSPVNGAHRELRHRRYELSK